MNKLEEIKNGLKCWDDHFPLNPPESKTEELLREEIKRRAQTFHAQGIENVRYLLSIIEQAEKALNRLYLACPPPATSKFEEESERVEYIESVVEAMEVLTEMRHGSLK